MLRVVPAAVLLSALTAPAWAHFGTSEVQPPSVLSLEPSSIEFTLATALSATRTPEPTRANAAPGWEAETERVEVVAADKMELQGTFYVPRDSDSKAPAALLLHDAGQTGEQLIPIAKYLNKRGFGVLILDIRGHGKSVAEGVNWAKMDEKEQERVWAAALDDVQAGAEWLRKRRGIHASNLTVLGVGASCALAARHAVNDENARAAVLIGPPSHALGFDILRDLKSLCGLPTLILCEKTGRKVASRMVEASHSANGGQEYIKIQNMKCKADKLCTDSKVKSNVGSWLREQVMPRRGR